jgi:hypothetical protein
VSTFESLVPGDEFNLKGKLWVKTSEGRAKSWDKELNRWKLLAERINPNTKVVVHCPRDRIMDHKVDA